MKTTLIDEDYLGKTKIPRGQQKLILASVNKGAVINAPAQQQKADDIKTIPNQKDAESTNAHEQPSDESMTT